MADAGGTPALLEASRPPSTATQRPDHLKPCVGKKKHPAIALPQHDHRPAVIVRMPRQPVPPGQAPLQRREGDSSAPVPPRDPAHRPRAKPAFAIEKQYPAHAITLPPIPARATAATDPNGVNLRVRLKAGLPTSPRTLNPKVCSPSFRRALHSNFTNIHE